MFLSRRSWHGKLLNERYQALHDIDVSVHQRPRLAFVDNRLKTSLAMVACMKAFSLSLVSTERADISLGFLPWGAIWLPGDKLEAPIIPRAWLPISLALGAPWKSFVALKPVSTDIHDSDSTCTCYTLMRRFTQVEQPLLRGTPTIFDHPLAQMRVRMIDLV